MFDRNLSPILHRVTPGPELVEQLDSVDRDGLDRHELVDLIKARAKVLAWAQAQLWADVAALDRAGPPPGWQAAAQGFRQRGDFVADELRPALCLTQRGAQVCLDYSTRISTELPQVWEAVAAGRIDRRRGEVFADETRLLSADRARLVVDKLVGRATAWTATVLRRRIRELVAAIDPEAAAKRHRQAVAGRRVWADLNPDDNTISITGDRLPTIQAAKAMARIRGLARSYRAAGDPRNLDQLAADLYLAMLNGEPLPDASAEPLAGTPGRQAAGEQAAGEPAAEATSSGAPTTGPATGPAPSPVDRTGLPTLANSAAVVELTVPLTTLMGLADTPGDLAGWGPVVADIARQFVADHPGGRWRWSVTDPDTGQLIAHDLTRRRPDSRVQAFVRARDRTCRAPGCTVPARSADLDHKVDHADGGPTAPENLGPLCRHDHRLKHESGWALTQPQPGTFCWTTACGHHYAVEPERLTQDFEPDWEQIAGRGFLAPPAPEPQARSTPVVPDPPPY